jgi:hypothetical protein
VADSPKKWKLWLSLAEFWYNTSYHSAIDCSPFKALYGHDANCYSVPTTSTFVDSSVLDLVADREAHFQLLKQHLSAARNRMKLQADKGRTDREFMVGEQVLLKLQPYKQHSVASRPFPKLAFKYYGPFRVLQKIGAVSYKLELPEGSLIHPVFHVSQLKLFTSNYSPVFEALPKVVDLLELGTELVAIVDRRMVKKGNKAIVQIKVRWRNVDPNFTTWEDYNVLRARFPSAIAWGQAMSQGGGDVMAGVNREKQRTLRWREAFEVKTVSCFTFS